MEYRTLGLSGLRVSAVGLGCMGMSHGYGEPADKREMGRLLTDAVDMGYTLFDTAEIYGTADDPHANEELLGIGFVAFSPLANGLLTNNYDKSYRFDPHSDYRAAMPQFSKESFDKNREFMDFIMTLADKKHATPSQISLAWMLCKKPWIVPIPGTRHLCRLKENAGAPDVKLSPEEIARIDSTLNSMPMSEVFGGSKILKPEN